MRLLGIARSDKLCRRGSWTVICVFINMESLKKVLDPVILLIFPRPEGDDTPITRKEYAGVAMMGVIVVIYVIAMSG